MVAMSHQWLLPSSWLRRITVIIALLTTAVSAGGVSIQNPIDVDLFPKRFVAGRGSLVSWKPTAEGTVSLKLYIGVSTEMQYISTIAHFIDNTGSFTWTPSIALDASDDYAILIISDANDQHVDCSPAFAIERPVLKRQEYASSYISDYLPYSTAPPPDPSPSPTPDPVTTTPPAAAATTSSVDPVPTSPINGQSSIVSSPSPASTNPASPTQPGQSSASTSPAAAGASSSSSSSLPTGAAIGIGVGATLVVLALVGLLIFFFLRRRRRLQRENLVASTQDAQTGFSAGPSELETGKENMAEKVQPIGGGNGGVGPQSPNMWAASDPKSELEAGAGAGAVGVGMGAGRAELSAPQPLSEEEYAELERRKRAVELQGRSMGVISGGGGPAELSAQGQGYGYPQGQFAGQGQQQVHPRAELEALRANARVAHELSGQSAWESGGPGYVQ